jgi:hypothetical protein
MVQGTETRLTGIGVSDGVALARARVRAPERADGAHSAPAEPSVETGAAGGGARGGTA